jgi:hypothetical protein
MGMGRAYARTAVSCLLAGSGAALIAAARERWWPACPWGGFDSGDCLVIQDDSYGSLGQPWLQAGHVADLQALSIALLGLAIAFLPRLWVRRPTALVLLSTMALSVSFVVVAGATNYSAWAGREVDFLGLGAAGVVWGLGWPLYLTVALVVALGAPYIGSWPRGTGWRLTFLVLLLLSTPVLQIPVAPALMSYMSYDHTPWADAVSGGFLVCAALVLWLATSPRPERPEQPFEGATVTGRGRTTQPTLPGRTARSGR